MMSCVPSLSKSPTVRASGCCTPPTVWSDHASPSPSPFSDHTTESAANAANTTSTSPSPSTSPTSNTAGVTLALETMKSSHTVPAPSTLRNQRTLLSDAPHATTSTTPSPSTSAPLASAAPVNVAVMVVMTGSVLPVALAINWTVPDVYVTRRTGGALGRRGVWVKEEAGVVGAVSVEGVGKRV